MVVLLEVSPIFTQDLWSSAKVTSRFLVSFLTKALLSRLLSLARQPALGRVRVVVAFPRSVPQHNPVTELCRQFLRPHGLNFSSDMHHQIDVTSTVYRLALSLSK